jgi:cell division septation protein DedD
MYRLKYVTGKPMRAAALVLTLGAVSGCEEGPNMAFLQPKDKTSETGSKPGQSTKLVERDVEAPDVFQVTEAGLWDGRPSLGGVWVAHPEVSDPQRVIIRNSANGKFVIGALFRREREIPGPRIQASSDAAAALGMLAGAPVELNITALIRESVPDEQEVKATVEDTSDTISETTLDPIAGAAAAIDASEPVAPPTVSDSDVAAAATVAAPKPKAKPKPKSSSLDKPYIQIGIFNVKANAEQTANQMRSAGMVPTVFEQSSNGKPFWRVVVGPAQNKSEGTALLKQVKSAGFSDAYFVTN